jgi:hypothetical protein
MIYCKFKLLHANEDVRRHWLVRCGAACLLASVLLHLLQQRSALGVRRHGTRQTARHTAQTKQNQIGNNSEGTPCSPNSGEFLQYQLPQTVHQPLCNSVTCLAVSSRYTCPFRKVLTTTVHWLYIFLHISEISGSNTDPQTGCRNFLCYILVNYTQKRENCPHN